MSVTYYGKLLILLLPICVDILKNCPTCMYVLRYLCQFLGMVCKIPIRKQILNKILYVCSVKIIDSQSPNLGQLYSKDGVPEIKYCIVVLLSK